MRRSGSWRGPRWVILDPDCNSGLIVHKDSTTVSMATPVVAGLRGSALPTKRTASKMDLTLAFVGEKVQTERPVSMSRVTCFQRNWLRKNLSVVEFGLIGWMAPSNLPVINGNSLTGLFLGSIGPKLAHFPTGLALTSPFWLWMITWHVGLFIVLTLGQIGFKGRQDGYWSEVHQSEDLNQGRRQV